MKPTMPCFDVLSAVRLGKLFGVHYRCYVDSIMFKKQVLLARTRFCSTFILRTKKRLKDRGEEKGSFVETRGERLFVTRFVVEALRQRILSIFACVALKQAGLLLFVPLVAPPWSVPFAFLPLSCLKIQLR